MQTGSGRVKAGTTASITGHRATAPAPGHVTTVDLELGVKVSDPESWFVSGGGEEGR